LPPPCLLSRSIQSGNAPYLPFASAWPLHRHSNNSTGGGRQSRGRIVRIVKQGYLVGDDVWWKAVVPSATVSCASTLQFLPLRLTYPIECTASARAKIQNAHAERRNEDRSAIPESFRNLHRVPPPSKPRSVKVVPRTGHSISVTATC
jgi:hypothetical protein